MKHYTLLLGVMFTLTSCFKERPMLPLLQVDQNQFIPSTPEICSNVDGAFEHFIFHGYEESDSIQWYRIYQNDTAYMGNGNPIYVTVDPPNRSFFCYQFFPNGDTIVSQTSLYSCFYSLYFPNAFGPSTWASYNSCFQIYANFEHNPESSVYWRVSTLDGVIVFETGNLNSCWDGTYQGHLVPTGPYLFYIKIEFENGEDYEFSDQLTVVE